MSELALVDLAPAARHRVVTARFTAVVDATTDWDAPTPVDGWVARDVVGHLTTWFPAFLAAGDVVLDPAPDATPDAATDPVGAWHAQVVSVQALLDDPDRAAGEFTHPQAGSHGLADAVDRFYTADVFMHTWDLARATGADDRLDAGWCEAMLAGMEPMDDLLRSSGQYGPRVEVGPDADATDRLVGFIGRDPREDVAEAEHGSADAG